MLSPWLRLYAHALLRETRIFPGMELRDESPGCSHNGFADIWKGDHHGEPVCIKVIRTRKSIPLEKIKKVCGSFILLETCSVRSIPGISCCKGRGETRPTSERAPRYRGFRGIVSALHHESMDVEWEHHPVHPGEPGCQSVDTGTWPFA